MEIKFGIDVAEGLLHHVVEPTFGEGVSIKNVVYNKKFLVINCNDGSSIVCNSYDWKLIKFTSKDGETFRCQTTTS